MDTPACRLEKTYDQAARAGKYSVPKNDYKGHKRRGVHSPECASGILRTPPPLICACVTHGSASGAAFTSRRRAGQPAEWPCSDRRPAPWNNFSLKRCAFQTEIAPGQQRRDKSAGYEKRTHGVTRKSLFSLEPAKRLELLTC